MFEFIRAFRAFRMLKPLLLLNLHSHAI
jgi:hypothetical protein